MAFSVMIQWRLMSEALLADVSRLQEVEASNLRIDEYGEIHGTVNGFNATLNSIQLLVLLR